jgi:hypothetical protein
MAWNDWRNIVTNPVGGAMLSVLRLSADTV